MNRYIDYAESTQTDPNGKTYLDPLSFDISKFIYSVRPQEYRITYLDKYRFDILIARAYGTADYRDIVLILNAIAHPMLMNAGDILLLPARKDIETFLKDQMV